MTHVMSTYSRLPVSFVRGEGVWLWDAAGRRYLDALSGIAVTGLGHAHPAVTRAIAEQAARLLHVSNLFENPWQEELADFLARISGMDRVFFSNSGAEANEAAIKIARLYGHGRGVDLPTVVVAERSFHGRTMATLSATGSRKVQAGFEPLVTGFARVPYGDLAAVEQVATHNDSVVAVLVEPIQGEGGIHLPPAGYLPGLRELCDRRGLLLMLDEIQSGQGRSGRWFAHQWADIRPDVMTLAKGLASGVPIGACLAAGPASEIFRPGNHGSTFGGNPLACAAALATLRAIEDQGLLANATRMGDLIQDLLRRGLAGVAGVVEVRGRGLMIGIELDRPCGELVRQALAQGLVLNVTSDSVIRLLPPLIIGEDEARQLVDTLLPLVRDFLRG